MTPVSAELRKQWEALARACSCGCGHKLLRADGRPDFSRRRFYSKQCIAGDKVNRIHYKRHEATQRPVITLKINGNEYRVAATPNEQAYLLRKLGHEVEIVRPPRKKRTKKVTA
jgi:hypothetical protein